MLAAANASWTFDPGPLILVAIAAWVYGSRWSRVHRTAGARGASRWRLASFTAGLLAVFAALVSPIDRLADQLFLMHMVQHVLLLDIAPILLIGGLTKTILRPVTRRLQTLERAVGPLGHPVFAIVVYVGVMYLWHIPALYDAALRHPGIHVIEHTLMSVAGLLYWWHLVSPIRARLRLGGLGPAIYMASTKLFVGLLGIVITFSPHAIYPFYAHAARTWGLSASTDQQIAGAIMALEQSIVMGIALAALFIRALGESEREEQRAERYRAV